MKTRPTRTRLLLPVLLCAPVLCACPHDGSAELPPGELPEEDIQASADPAAAIAADQLELDRRGPDPAGSGLPDRDYPGGR